LGQLPVLEIERHGESKKVIPQANAILRYVGMLAPHIIYPPDQALEIDSLLETMTEFERPFILSAQGLVSSLISDEDWSETEMLAMRHRLLAIHIPKYFGYFEHILEKNQNKGGWLVGDHLSIADIKWHFLLSILQEGNLAGIPANVADAYPHITKHLQNVISYPEIQAWYERFPEPPYPTFDYKPN
jgi:glutathione S-transferase